MGRDVAAAGVGAEATAPVPLSDLGTPLQRCPECGYLLTGLPPDGRCPECGFAYDSTMIVLQGWGFGQHANAANSRGGRAVAALIAQAGILGQVALNFMTGRVRFAVGFLLLWAAFAAWGCGAGGSWPSMRTRPCNFDSIRRALGNATVTASSRFIRGRRPVTRG